jgi:peptide/nickel transport system permease protein
MEVVHPLDARARQEGAAPPSLFAPMHKRSALHMAIRRHPTIVIGALILVLLILASVLAPWLGTTDPSNINPGLRARVPSAEYFFGTDVLGRDIYSRVLYGTRVSLAVGFSVAALAIVLGMALGLVAGFVRWVDGALMRCMDAMMSIPPVLLAIALMTLTRPSMGNVILAITLAEVPRVARLVRSVTLSLREQPYIDAAVTVGTRIPVIIVRHILPNTVGPMLVQATYICASAMIAEAVLSFIGAGVPSTVPSWGNIMAEGRVLWQVKPHIIFFPALFLSLTVLAINLLGDGLRDALDPKLAKGM